MINIDFKDMIFLIVYLMILSYCCSFHIAHRVACNRVQLCNGNLMCAMVCQRGSVKVDPWITSALDYQRQFQRQSNTKLLFYQFPSTHNSAITEADGFGIEKYFISALYGGRDYDQGDDLGEGVCQYLSLTDQLRMGVRHLEVDVWWLLEQIEVCHSPVPLFPVENVTRTAQAANLTLEWEPDRLSCAGTKRSFEEVLREIYDWMMEPDNKHEMIILYFDTKRSIPAHGVTKANDIILSVFGDMLWKPSEGNPLQNSVVDMISKDKRVIIENMKDCWSQPSEGEPLVFYPTLWTHQFSYSDLQEFPNCSIQGDGAWFGSQMVRALDGSVTEAATRCGATLVSGDYVNPDDMRLYVWTWDEQEPSSTDGCTAMLPSGRWATLPCNTPLPFACISNESVNSGDYTTWMIDLNASGPWNKAICEEGKSFAAPTNSFSNNLLINAAFGQMLWLNAPTSFK